MIIPVGGMSKVKIDIRVIAATNKNLKEALEKGEFRKDLYHRLNKIPIDLPPLSKRKEDIPELVHHILIELKVDIEEEAINYLQSYDWPGNVRQLENIVERASLLRKDKNGKLTVDEIKKALSLEGSTFP